MATTPTTRNRLAKQGTGDNVGSWSTVLNGQVIDLVDELADGVTTLTITGNATLTSTNYATDQARKRVLKLTGSPGASYTVTIPSVEKFYIVYNGTNAAQTIKAGGVGVSVPASAMLPVFCDGTDCFTQATATAVIVDRAYAEYTTSADITGTIPQDDTIPQVGEGTQILSASITPKSTSNRLRASFLGQADPDLDVPIIAALFVNGAANAVRSVISDTSGTAWGQIALVHEFVPGSVAAQTLTIRVGTPTGSGALFRMNGSNAGRLFGGTCAATLILEEITA